MHAFGWCTCIFQRILKKYIDYLAFYKMNTFHRISPMIRICSRKKQISQTHPVVPGAVAPWIQKCHDSEIWYDSIRRILPQKRDSMRNRKMPATEILPYSGIEMPLGSAAALAAYPEFGCIDTTLWGRGWGGFDDILSKRRNLHFYWKYFDEIMDLFPSTYSCGRWWSFKTR